MLEVEPTNVLKVSRHRLQGESVSSDHKTMRHTRSEHGAVYGRCLRVEEAAKLSALEEPSNRSLSALFGCLMPFRPP